MRAILILGAAAVALSATATSASASPIAQIRNAAARVVVMPDNRPDVKFEFITVNASLPIELRTEGDKVIADGGLKHRIHGCNSISFGFNGKGDDHRNTTVRISGIGKVSYENLPQLVVHVPMDARVETSGAVWGSVGRSSSLSLGNAGCGDWTVANVRGELKLSQAGSGDVRAGTSGDLKVSIAGSGDVATQATGGGADLSIAGSGDINVAAMNGVLDADIAGSGDIHVHGGHASSMSGSIAGSGDIVFDGTADSMKASIAGSGDVTGAHVTGPVSKSILGSGSVYANGKELPRGRHHDDDDDD
jgi:hypothetical protein